MKHSDPDDPYPFHTSLINAAKGILHAFVLERNLKIHVAFSVFAIGLGIYFHLPRIEWAILYFSIFLVVVAEMINTAIEITVDLSTKKQRKFRAMLSKDIAAGAVLLTSINAMVMGYILFYDRFMNLIEGVMH